MSKPRLFTSVTVFQFKFIIPFLIPAEKEVSSTGRPKSERDLVQTPAFTVPAKTSLPLIARDQIHELVRPLVVFVQLIPWFFERKTPPPVPKKILVSIKANA